MAILVLITSVDLRPVMLDALLGPAALSTGGTSTAFTLTRRQAARLTKGISAGVERGPAIATTYRSARTLILANT